MFAKRRARETPTNPQVTGMHGVSGLTARRRQFASLAHRERRDQAASSVERAAISAPMRRSALVEVLGQALHTQGATVIDRHCDRYAGEVDRPRVVTRRSPV